MSLFACCQPYVWRGGTLQLFSPIGFLGISVLFIICLPILLKAHTSLWKIIKYTKNYIVYMYTIEYIVYILIYYHYRKPRTFLFKAFMGICCLAVITMVLYYATQSQKLWMPQFRQTVTKNREAAQNKTANTSGKGIPKIIHQIWNTHVIPAVFHDNIIGLASHNKPPDWQYYFWTLPAGEQFIREKMPWLLQRYMRARRFFSRLSVCVFVNNGPIDRLFDRLTEKLTS